MTSKTRGNPSRACSTLGDHRFQRISQVHASMKGAETGRLPFMVFRINYTS